MVSYCPYPDNFAALSSSDQEAVKRAMKAYNNIYLDQPYFEVEEFYQNVYRVGGWFF